MLNVFFVSHSYPLEVAQSVKTKSNEAEITNSNLPPSACADMSKYIYDFQNYHKICD
jgi:hypothetical protein